MEFQKLFYFNYCLFVCLIPGFSLKTFSKSCSESDGSLSIDETDGCYTPDEGNAFPPAKSFK